MRQVSFSNSSQHGSGADGWRTASGAFGRGTESAVRRTQERPWRSTCSLARHHQYGARGRDQGQYTAGRVREGVRRQTGG